MTKLGKISNTQFPMTRIQTKPNQKSKIKMQNDINLIQILKCKSQNDNSKCKMNFSPGI